jgi:hypothetical protein
MKTPEITKYGKYHTKLYGAASHPASAVGRVIDVMLYPKSFLGHLGRVERAALQVCVGTHDGSGYGKFYDIVLNKPEVAALICILTEGLSQMVDEPIPTPEGLAAQQ